MEHATRRTEPDPYTRHEQALCLPAGVCQRAHATMNGEHPAPKPRIRSTSDPNRACWMQCIVAQRTVQRRRDELHGLPKDRHLRDEAHCAGGERRLRGQHGRLSAKIRMEPWVGFRVAVGLGVRVGVGVGVRVFRLWSK